MPWLTGDTVGGDTICRRLLIPNDISLIAAVNGALHGLTKEYNWQQHGASTPKEVATAMRDMWLAFVTDDCEVESGSGMRTIIKDWTPLVTTSAFQVLRSEVAPAYNVHIEVRGAVASSSSYENLSINLLDGSANIVDGFSVGGAFGGSKNWLSEDFNTNGYNYLRVEIPLWLPDGAGRFMLFENFVGRRQGVGARGFGSVVPYALNFELGAGEFSADSKYRITGEN